MPGPHQGIRYVVVGGPSRFPPSSGFSTAGGCFQGRLLNTVVLRKAQLRTFIDENGETKYLVPDSISIRGNGQKKQFLDYLLE